jgi:hypothetical protein
MIDTGPGQGTRITATVDATGQLADSAVIDGS